MDFTEFSVRVHNTAKEKGWWDKDSDQNVLSKIALMHSELSEALEEFRAHPEMLDVYFNEESMKPEGFVIELADCIIRICDLCEYLGLDITDALLSKAGYNETRPYRHGGKSA